MQVTILKNYNEITDKVINTVNAKNDDYGSAFEQSFKEYGWVAYLIRIQDKINRLKTLTLNKQNPKVISESIEDTLQDIMGYTLLMSEICNRTKDIC